MGNLCAIFMFIFFITLPAAESNTASDFNLSDIDGNSISLDSMLTKGPVFMSFWSLQCKMCIKELDALKSYYDEFDSLGVNFLAVSVDKMRALPQVKPFVKSRKWKYTIILDPENVMRDLYNVQAMPTSFIIDQNKNIIFTHQGYKPGDEKLIVENLYCLLENKPEDEDKD